jgi:hypothetical protein
MARMTIHYHGLPITGWDVFYTLKGRHFCVSFHRPDQVKQAHEVGQSVMLDNGAFSAWKSGNAIDDWRPYYEWTDRWLDYPTTWAVIPDVINAGAQFQDALLREWPHGRERAAPVWHLDEPIDRLVHLTKEWPRVCMGSTEEYRDVLSPIWVKRMRAAWKALRQHHKRPPNIHMLRGMQLSGLEWPFASVDSTDIGRNHNRQQNTAKGMAERWDAMQCAAKWPSEEETMELFA